MTDSDFVVLRLGVNNQRPDFDCGDDDLNEFFLKDSKESCNQLLAVTYLIKQNEDPVAFFSVSNDSVRKELLSNRRIRKLFRTIPWPKRYSSMPAVKIGRLAVKSTLQRSGIGTEILNFVKGWFTVGNKTGCRFVLIDAYNKPEILSFYQKNGFSFLVEGDANHQTRLMYFDLITVVNRELSN